MGLTVSQSPSSACVHMPRLFHGPDCFTVSTCSMYIDLGSRGCFGVNIALVPFTIFRWSIRLSLWFIICPRYFYLSATSSSMLPGMLVVPVFLLFSFCYFLVSQTLCGIFWSCGLLMRAFPVVLHLKWLWVPLHPPIGGMVLWCPCRLFLSLVVSFLGLCLLRPLVLHILIPIALLLAACYLWCGFLWFFHVWF